MREDMKWKSSIVIFVFSNILVGALCSSGPEYVECGSKSVFDSLQDGSDYEVEANKKCSFFSESAVCDLAYAGGVCSCEESHCYDVASKNKNCSKQKYEKGKSGRECAKYCRQLDDVAFVCQNPRDKRKYCVCVNG